MSSPAVLRQLRFFLDLPHTTGAQLVPALLREFEGQLERDDGARSPSTTALVREHIYATEDPAGFTRQLQERGTKLLLGCSPYSKFSGVFTPEHVVLFLRDPFVRVVAHWEAACARAEFSGSLTEFATTPRHRNLQSRLLKGAPLRRLGFLGSSENYQKSFERLRQISNFALLPAELGQDAPVKPTYEPTPAERAAILDANAHDIALYERAAFSRQPQNVFTRIAHLFGGVSVRKEKFQARRKNGKGERRKRRDATRGPTHRGCCPSCPRSDASPCFSLKRPGAPLPSSGSSNR